MAYLSAVPIRLNDGRKPNGLRVLELKEALNPLVFLKPGMLKTILTS
jgi:hypothetical protein